MTTSVTILNNGPRPVLVQPIDDKGETNPAEQHIVNGLTIATLTVWKNRNVIVSEM